jgi:hypothetical protein
MVTARAGLETWVAKKFKQDARLSSKVLGPEATLKEKIDSLREACRTSPAGKRASRPAHRVPSGTSPCHPWSAREFLADVLLDLSHVICRS